MRVSQKPLDIVSVTDHRELYRAMNDTRQEILREEERDGKRSYLLLSPRTPQMGDRMGAACPVWIASGPKC
jgi:hypothetical protein